MPLNTGVRPKLYRRVRLALLFAVIYAVLDYSLNRFGFSSGWTILWPLNGVTIALLLMRGRGDWPAILLGVGVGTGIGECLDGNAVGLAVCLRAISLTEVILSALLLPAFTTLDEWLRQRWIFLRFAGAMVVGPTVSGLMAAALYHHIQNQPSLAAFNDWATSDALGIAAMMPLALCVGSHEMQKLFRGTALLRTIGLLTLAFGVFDLTLSVATYPLTFLLFPTLLMLDLTLSFAGSAIGMAGLCFFSMYLTTHGMGPFGNWSPDLWVPRGVALQAFLGFPCARAVSSVHRATREAPSDGGSKQLQ